MGRVAERPREASSSQARIVDLVVRRAVLLTMDPARRILDDGALAIHGGRIVAIGGTSEVDARFAPARVLDADGGLVHPGFVDAHTRVSEHLGRSTMPDDWGPADAHRQWVPYALGLDEEAERAAALLAFMEMALNGTTAFCDMGGRLPARNRAAAAESVGLRGLVSEGIWDRPPDPRLAVGDADDCLARVAGLLDELPPGSERLVAGSVALPGAGARSEELLLGAAELAAARGSLLHLQERFERPEERAPGGVLDGGSRARVLGPRTLLVHVCHATGAELVALARTRTHVAHCPAAAARVGLGIGAHGPVPAMLAAGVNVALGSGGGNFSDRFDVGLQMYLTAMLHRDGRRRLPGLGVEQALEMATINGARAIGLGEVCGSLEVGKAADLVVRDVAAPELHPLINVPVNLVFAASSRGIRHVLVAGRHVVSDGELVAVDAGAVLEEVAEATRRLRDRSRFAPAPRWPRRRASATS